MSGVGIGQIPVQLRIGVVGHRWILNDAHSALAVGDAVAEIWASRANRSTTHTPVGLTIVSALAEGADRLVADAGQLLGARLEVILPMAIEEYELDFETQQSRLHFRALLSAAAHVAALESRGTREESYREAGRRVVDRCDVLLAVWDGQPSRGPGGTAEIVEYADRRGTPVRWLEARRSDGVLEVNLRSGRRDAEAVGPLTARAFRALDFFNSRTMTIPAAGVAAIAPTDASLAFEPFYARADQIANRYQRGLLRSSRAIYTLAVLAVAVVTTQLVFAIGRDWLPWVEVAALAAITTILVWGRRRGLLRRWLSARHLAERLRIAAVLRSAGAPHPPAWGSPVEHDDWVDRSIEELWIATDEGPHATPLPEVKRALIARWLEPQIAYHERTRAMAIRRQHRFAVPMTFVLFGLSLVAALLHALEWFGEDWGRVWSTISIVAPTAAAAVSGYVGQREYVRRARRSRQASQNLQVAQREIESTLDPAELHRILDRLQPELASEAQDWSISTTIHDLEVP